MLVSYHLVTGVPIDLNADIAALLRNHNNDTHGVNSRMFCSNACERARKIDFKEVEKT